MNITARIASLATLALAALPAAALSTAAYAQPAHAVVRIADLNMASASGRATYEQRVDVAARQFCAREINLNVQAACEAAVHTEANEKLAAGMQLASR